MNKFDKVLGLPIGLTPQDFARWRHAGPAGFCKVAARWPRKGAASILVGSADYGNHLSQAPALPVTLKGADHGYV